MFQQIIQDGPTRSEIKRLENGIPALVSQHIDSLLRGLNITLTRDTVMAPDPLGPALFWLDRQASGQGDIFYVGMQKANGQWKWFQVVKAT